MSGAGKKAPSNLKYDVVRGQVVDINCPCDVVNNGCYGVFDIFGSPGSTVVCNGTTCSGLIKVAPVVGIQVNMIVGTTYTMLPTEVYTFVNCTRSGITVVVDTIGVGSSPPTIIPNNYVLIVIPTGDSTITFLP